MKIPNVDDQLQILLCGELASGALGALLMRYGLDLQLVPDLENIPGTFWGEPEAGLIGNTLYVRSDTPVHSALHESCHYICMDTERREALHTNAGGTHAEEDAVCYLQILLSDYLPGAARARSMADMDAWGYSFRLGSAQAWFENDAQEAQDWLVDNELIDKYENPRWRLRESISPATSPVRSVFA